MEDQSRFRSVDETVSCRNGGLRLNGDEFGLGTGGEIGLEAVLDHGGAGCGNKIEVEGLRGI